MKTSGKAGKLKVLDSKSDPFWLAPARLRDAQWIGNLWKERISLIWKARRKEGKRERKAYDRGIHYILVSLGIECPWGQNRRVHTSPLYLNVDSDFNKIVGAIRDARNWGLMPWDAIEDRKHVGLEEWINYGQFPGNRLILPFENFDGDGSYELGVSMPDVQEVKEATFQEADFEADVVDNVVNNILDKNMTGISSARYQPYYVAMVSEKSGTRPILLDALDQLDHGFDFLNFEGQASTTVVRKFVENRLLAKYPFEHPIPQKKIRIFYLSDYDYAGRVMPPAFIQKLFFYLWEKGIEHLDIKVKKLALTKELVDRFDLPPAPIPARSLGAKTLQDRWLKDFGRIVEIEAMDTLHPGELEKIIVEAAGKYIDQDLADDVKEKLSEVQDEATDAIRAELANWEEDWLEARAELLKAINDLNAAIRRKKINESLRNLQAEIEKLNKQYDTSKLISKYKDTLEGIHVEFEAPELDFHSSFVAEEDDDWLFDSSRDSIEQAKKLRKYKP